MKILIATPLYPPDIGGPATYAKILNEELPKHDTFVQIISYGMVRHLPWGIAHAVYFARLLSVAAKCDLVLALDPVSVGLPALCVARCLRKKFVVRIAGDYAWEQGKQRFGVKENLDEFVKKPLETFLLPVRILRRVQSFVARNAALVIVPSKYFQGVIVSWGISPEKIAVIYNAFAAMPRLPSREELRKNFGFSGKVLFSAGRLVPWKGFSTLIGLMPEIRKKHPDCRLFIAGSGPLLHELKSQIAKENLGEIVTMLGDVPHLKLMEYKHAADCFVLNTGYEGFSHHLLEALAVGTPIVATRVGGNTEIVRDGETGVLVDYNDMDALRPAILGVLQNPEGAEKLAEQGKKFAAGFTVERMAKETLLALGVIGTSKKQ